MKKPNFYYLSFPFSIVNGVVWGIGIVSLPLLAKTTARAGLTFAMLNLGIATGAIVWGHLSSKFKLNNLIFTGTILSFLAWLAIVLLNGKFLIPLAFVFGTFTASIFTFASVMITNTYPKELWDKYIAQMQAFMTFGTVVGLLVTAIFPKAVTGLPFLFLAILFYLPFYKHHRHIAVHHKLHASLLKPKMHFAELFNGYFHQNIRWKHFLNFKNKSLLLLNVQWIFVLLAPEPVYAMYPLLMKKAFHLSASSSSLVYALSTAFGVVLFIAAGKIAKKRSPFFTMNLGTLSYILSFLLMLTGIWTQFFFIGIFGFMFMIFSWAFISTGMNIGVVELTSEKKRGEALGLANSFQSIDNVLGGAIGGFVVASMGYPVILYFGVLFSCIAIILSIFQHNFKSENYAVQKEKD